MQRKSFNPLTEFSGNADTSKAASMTTVSALAVAVAVVVVFGMA